MKFADELKARSEDTQRREILAELERARLKAEEQLYEIKAQKQRVIDVITQVKSACLDAADNGDRSFSLEIMPFLSRKLPLTDDPVYRALIEFFKTEGMNYEKVRDTMFCLTW